MADRDALLGAIKAAYCGALGAAPSAGFIERQKSALAGGSSAAVLIEDIFASGTYASRLNRRAQTEDRAIYHLRLPTDPAVLEELFQKTRSAASICAVVIARPRLALTIVAAAACRRCRSGRNTR